MKEKAVYFKIGLFFISVIAVLLIGLAWLRSEQFKGEPVFIETCLDESVQGLEVGSTVKYRGVSVGIVDTITFVSNVYPLQVDSPAFAQYGGQVLVVMKLDRGAFPGLEKSGLTIDQVIHKQVDLGLRLKLSYQGITGITFMEADYLDPQRNPPPEKLPWTPEHQYIPSTPSLMTNFTQSLDKINRRLEQIDFEGLISKMQTTLDSIEKAVRDADIAQVRLSAISLIDELRTSNGQLQEFLEQAQNLPADIRNAAAQFNQTLSSLNTLIQRNEPEAEKVMADLKVLTQNLRQLSDNLKMDPGQLIFSVPPKPSENVQ